MNLAAFERPPGAGAARSEFPALTGDGPLLVFLGRLHPVKGLEHLLRAIPLLRTPARLAIAGEGDPAYLAALRALADSLHLGTRVVFLGAVAPGLRASLYRCASLFVLPSSQENFGLVLFEAMASGTPVLTTDRVDTKAELEEAGAIIVRQEAGAIAAGVDAALASGAELAARAERGRGWVAAELDPGRVLERYRACYAGEVA
jgi:glycosyltransferase involved in cell wall biosynthesis